MFSNGHGGRRSVQVNGSGVDPGLAIVRKFDKSSGRRYVSGSYEGRCRYSRIIPKAFGGLLKKSLTCRMTRRIRGCGRIGIGVGPVGKMSRTALARLLCLPAWEEVTGGLSGKEEARLFLPVGVTRISGSERMVAASGMRMEPLEAEELLGSC